jgi:hypothetical protein
MYKLENININTIKLIKLDESKFDDYNKEILDNGDIILTKKIKNEVPILIDSFYRYDMIRNQLNFNYSKIISCSINKKKIDDDKLYYHLILNEILFIVKDYKKIVETNSIQILNYKSTLSEYYYLEELNISVHSAGLGHFLYEIILQCNNNNIDLDITIKLNNEEFYQFVI